MRAPADRRIALTRRDLAWTLALCLVTVVIWCTAAGRWDRRAWRTTAYHGDSLYNLALIKAFADGEIVPVLPKYVDSLNAPLGAQWNDFPMMNEPVVFLTGLVARVVGLFPAANAAVLAGHLLAAVSFYLVARMLGARTSMSAMGALLFAFSRYVFVRSFTHLGLAYCWHLPLCILVVYWAGSDERLRAGSRRWWIALAVGVAAGVQSVYYANALVQLLLLAALVQLARKRSRHALSVAQVVAAAVLAVLVINSDTLAYGWKHGSNLQVVKRSLRSLEKTALQPIELFLPVGHSWEAFERLAEERYLSQQGSIPVDLKRRVMQPSYVGLTGAIALLWLLGVSFYRLARAGPSRGAPMEMWQMVWVLAYSIPGGLNWFGGVFLGMYLFRGANRYSILVLALALLFLVRELSRRVPARACVVLALVVTPLGLWDQLGAQSPAGESRRGATEIRSDAALLERLEAELPAGASIFQLPAAEFPEAGYAGKTTLAMLRPYLHTRGLRYSFGDHKGRLREAWQAQVAALPVAQMVAQLERLGFHGVLIHGLYFADGGRSLVADLGRAGRRRRTRSEVGDLAFVYLRPRTRVASVASAYGPGWYGPGAPPADGRRWAGSEATVLVYNFSGKRTEARLYFRLMALRAQTVTILRGGETLVERKIPADLKPKAVRLTLALEPGVHRLRLRSDVGPERLKRGPPVTFAIDRLRLRDAEELVSGRAEHGVQGHLEAVP